ncbi:MAG TPA: tRNA lysidine(34) synthetase TilS [Syntrophales bacterium]|nr:tRNA lysidine(34) synthetase TilS [Syntrophales bacterium]HPC01154.1 tRNA lysidine(34) synthetase TilS [Syntrophales bacterium]HRS86975.1 tRNA lysidine(34) synthetase TilS [Syntrophales bacterium]HRV42538.1 tRNA lysidine(34) synthetase TilS [Syntrophales bacterium]
MKRRLCRGGPLVARVARTIEENAMLGRGDRVVAAVSGGADSVALLMILTDLAPFWDWEIVVAHLNHSLRPEAEREEAFVRDLAASLGYPWEVRRVATAEHARRERIGLEAAGRELRRLFLEETARKVGARRIALGHHRGDRAETVLMHILKGTGVSGLAAMAPVHGDLYIRPLLDCTRDEILAYLDTRGIAYVTDPSNASRVFLRNRIRHDLLPLLREGFNPRVEESLARLAAVAGREDDYLAAVASSVLAEASLPAEPPVVRLSLTVLRGCHGAVLHRVLREVLRRFTPRGQGVLFRHVEAAAALVGAAKPCGTLKMPFGVTVEIRGEVIVIGPSSLAPDEGRGEADYAYPLTIPGEVQVPQAALKVRLTLEEREGGEEAEADAAGRFMDLDALVPPLVVRNRRPGDRFRPLGAGGSKKLHDFFIDLKVPRGERSVLPLIADRGGIVWVGGLRIDERVRLTAATRRVVRAEIV